MFVLPVFNMEAKKNEDDATRIPPNRPQRSHERPQARSASETADFIGFTEASLLKMMNASGKVPPFGKACEASAMSFEVMRSRALKQGKVLVVLPECTTSNARGLLKFTGIFKGLTLPVTDFGVYIMCARYVTLFLRCFQHLGLTSK